ncbi:MAG: response regulator transcription factor [Oscillospiraceae bacterium]|jgi:DNA-binding response OmpR family regulator|nr:response regulator transcription factor [Oscillospiraceae bacterium]
MKILVVDDEPLLVKGIKFNLQNEGYEVDTAGDGLSAVRLARSGGYDLVILDLMMPRLGGLEACQRIREFSTVPVIMLTARSEDSDKILGFESGADDYITKPFNIIELRARIRALLRRSGSVKSERDAPDDKLVAGSVTVDGVRRAAWKDGALIDLTAKEYDIIELLAKNPGRVYSREQLLDIVWGVDYQGDVRTVDVHIRRLREKLETDAARPELICTKWGVGYYLNG